MWHLYLPPFFSLHFPAVFLKFAPIFRSFNFRYFSAVIFFISTIIFAQIIYFLLILLYHFLQTFFGIISEFSRSFLKFLSLNFHFLFFSLNFRNFFLWLFSPFFKKIICANFLVFEFYFFYFSSDIFFYFPTIFSLFFLKNYLRKFFGLRIFGIFSPFFSSVFALFSQSIFFFFKLLFRTVNWISSHFYGKNFASFSFFLSFIKKKKKMFPPFPTNFFFEHLRSHCWFSTQNFVFIVLNTCANICFYQLLFFFSHIFETSRKQENVWECLCLRLE